MSAEQQDGAPHQVIDRSDIAAPAGPGEFKGIDVKAPVPGIVRFSKNTKIGAIIVGVLLIVLVGYGIGIFDSNKSPNAAMTPAPPLALASGGPVSTTSSLGNTLDGSSEHGVATPPPPKLSKPGTINGAANTQGPDPLAAALNNGANVASGASSGTTAANGSGSPQQQPSMGPVPTFAPFQPQQNIVPNPGNAANTSGYGPPQNQVATTAGSSQNGTASHDSLYVGNNNVGQGGDIPTSTQNQSSGSQNAVSLPQSPGGGNAMIGNDSGAANPANPNGQNEEQRIKFANGDASRPPYLAAVRDPSIDQFELWDGSIIPAQLDYGINASLPGVIRAHVTEDVYDSKTGQVLIIPKWSTLIGRYNSVVTQGMARVQVVFDRLIWPDGTYINLDGMAGGDRNANAGLFADVNDHRGQIFTAAIITGAISAGAQILAGGAAGTTVVQSNGQIVSQSVGGELAQTGGQYIQQKMNVPPEPTVPLGQNFTVVVDRTIPLTAWTYGRTPSSIQSNP